MSQQFPTLHTYDTQNNRHLFLMSMYKFWLLKNIPTTSIIMLFRDEKLNFPEEVHIHKEVCIL